MPWMLAAASPAYSGVANSWNCSAAFEAPRHRLQGECRRPLQGVHKR